MSAIERSHFDRIINTMHWGRTISMESYCHIIGLYNDRLEAFSAEHGYAYLPVAERMAGGAAVFTDICHMTLEGINRKAEVFAELLAPMVENALAEMERPDVGA